MTALGVIPLTEHGEGGGPLFVSRWVGGVLAGVAASVCHSQVGDADGRVLQSVVEEDDPVLEIGVGKALPINRVEHGDVVPLALNGFPNPRHLDEWGVKSVVIVVSVTFVQSS